MSDGDGYLLDTNVCIALINGRPPRMRERLAGALAEGAPVAVPAVAAFELWFGVAKSEPRRRRANRVRVEAFLAGPVEVIPFAEEDAPVTGRIREVLRAAGTPIGPYDLLIAGQAVSRGLTVVTANGREFGRVAGLSWVNWAADA